MCDQHAHAGEVWLAKLPPHALVKTADSVVGVGSALAIRDAVEEVAIIGSFLPHALHFSRTWLKVAEILLTQARFFEDGYFVAREGRGGGVIGGEGAQYAFGGLASAAIG